IAALSLGAAKNTAKNCVDMREMKLEIELIYKLGLAQMLPNVLVGFEQGEKVAIAGPCFHRVALNQTIGVLAAHAFLRQRQQYALRMNEPAQPVEVLLHIFGIDNELADDAGKTRKGKIERHRGVRPDHPLH